MASGEVKGKAIALDALFSPEETSRAVQRVEEVVAERRRELDRLRSFASDNSSLSSLVQRLPDETSHDIMVNLPNPFNTILFLFSLALSFCVLFIFCWLFSVILGCWKQHME
jgi:hypothetical protein